VDNRDDSLSFNVSGGRLAGVRFWNGSQNGTVSAAHNPDHNHNHSDHNHDHSDHNHPDHNHSDHNPDHHNHGTHRGDHGRNVQFAGVLPRHRRNHARAPTFLWFSRLFQESQTLQLLKTNLNKLRSVLQMNFIASLWEEIAFFFYKLYRILCSLNWACFGNVTSYYLVNDQGKQLNLSVVNYATVKPAALLVIYYTREGVKYLFLDNYRKGPSTEEEIRDIKRAYQNYKPPDTKFIGINVTIGEDNFDLNAEEFMVAGSTLFTPTFNQWLCRHYLNIQPSRKLVATLIDVDINFQTTEAPLSLEYKLD
jgi:hypothetical protein